MDIQPHIEAFSAWLKDIGRAAQTLEHHRCSLKLWRRFLDAKGVTGLAQVTPQIVADYQAWLYAARSRYGRPYTLESQIGILNSLQVFHKFLVKTGRLLTNPAEALRLPKEPKNLPGKTLTPAEMKRLLAQPDIGTVLGFRDRTLYEVLYSTGLRITEAIRLRIQDIPPSLSALAGPELRRAGNLPSAPKGCLFIHAGKGGKDRVVPLGAAACRYLVEYLQRVRPVLLRNSEPSADSAKAVLFLDRLGKPFDKSGILKKLAIYATRAGISAAGGSLAGLGQATRGGKSEIRCGGKKRVTVHTFRHTLATEMLRHGADLRQIQELLGHASLRTTQIYTHIVKGDLKRVQSQCHPREQTELPEGFAKYRGRKYLTDEDKQRK